MPGRTYIVVMLFRLVFNTPIRPASCIPFAIVLRTIVRSALGLLILSPQKLLQPGLALLFCCLQILPTWAQVVWDDFQGQGTINTWFGDHCTATVGFPNPHPHNRNTSTAVLRYQDTGGQYANVRFERSGTYPMASQSRFRLKVYLSSAGTSTNQQARISLKLQNNLLPAPWSTQCEIIKPLIYDQWQEVQFDFRRDPFINLSPNSAAPTARVDFNRVVIQLNGENNNDPVLAYLDDFLYDTLGYYPGGRALVWSDEFNTTGPVDPEKWHAQTLLPNGNSWFNNELQHYTDRPENAYCAQGSLKIVARRENRVQQGVTKSFTSARLNARHAFRYGRVELRARVPGAAGTWPALWMLGRNIQETGAYFTQLGYGTTGWPACGEIDIMEHWGTQPQLIHSSVHTPSSYGATQNTATRLVSGAISSFQVYSLDWEPHRLVFSINGQPLYTYQPTNRTASTWPFDASQYLIMNVAMLSAVSPAFLRDSMEIDYLRVYQDSLDLPGPLVVRGMLRYGHPQGAALNAGSVVLRQYGDWAGDTAIGTAGQFGFYGLAAGLYGIEPRISVPWGGVNASDALRVIQHFGGSQPLTGLPLLAADVNGSQTVNASDGLLIAQRYTGLIGSFPVGDWVSETAVPRAARNLNDLPIPLLMLCTGDVNASYLP